MLLIFINKFKKMKTKSIICLLLICFSWSVFAQEDVTSANNTPPEKKHKFWIGPKFGLDLSSTTTDINGVTNQLKGNYQAGILFQFGSTLYIQPEIYYATVKTVISPTNTKSVNSIRVPLMLGLRFLDLGLFSLHIMGGPTYSLKLDDADRLTGDKAFSWQVGAGIDVLGFVTGDLRYTLIENMSIADQVTHFTTNPTILNLTVGLKLR